MVSYKSRESIGRKENPHFRIHCTCQFCQMRNFRQILSRFAGLKFVALADFPLLSKPDEKSLGRLWNVFALAEDHLPEIAVSFPMILVGDIARHHSVNQATIYTDYGDWFAYQIRLGVVVPRFRHLSFLCTYRFKLSFATCYSNMSLLNQSWSFIEYTLGRLIDKLTHYSYFLRDENIVY